MSFSINGSNGNNPLLSLQSQWQQATSSNSTPTSSDPLSALLAAIGQPSAGATAAASGTNSAGAGAAAATGGTTAQFGPQTLQALLALQNNGSTPQSLASQFDNAINGADPLSALQSSQSQAQHGRHHHHHPMDANGDDRGNGPGGVGATGNTGGQNPLAAQLQQLQTLLSAPASTQSITTA